MNVKVVYKISAKLIYFFPKKYFTFKTMPLWEQVVKNILKNLKIGLKCQNFMHGTVGYDYAWAVHSHACMTTVPEV